MNEDNPVRVLQTSEKSYRDCNAAAEAVRLRRIDGDHQVVLQVGREEYLVERMVSVFPLSARMKRVALFDRDGEEIGILSRIKCLDRESRRLIDQMLDKTYYMPIIEKILGISDHMGMEKWQVETSRGKCSFEVRFPRRNVRFLNPQRLMIKDVDGNRYEIRDWRSLDRRSRKLLTRHL